MENMLKFLVVKIFDCQNFLSKFFVEVIFDKYYVTGQKEFWQALCDRPMIKILEQCQNLITSLFPVSTKWVFAYFLTTQDNLWQDKVTGRRSVTYAGILGEVGEWEFWQSEDSHRLRSPTKVGLCGFVDDVDDVLLWFNGIFDKVKIRTLWICCWCCWCFVMF